MRAAGHNSTLWSAWSFVGLPHWNVHGFKGIRTDGVDIGDWTDEKGRVHKEADAPKYKALGNSIALPFWRWMFGRMAAYLPDGATLGSLFDGIGGFPLCWESIHGKGTAVWASEIDEFPIAVTKHHFEESNNKKT